MAGDSAYAPATTQAMKPCFIHSLPTVGAVVGGTDVNAQSKTGGNADCCGAHPKAEGTCVVGR